MSPPYLFHFRANKRNWKHGEVSSSVDSEMGNGEHTLLEREVADIIIYMLHQQGSATDLWSSKAVPMDFGFPKWNRKRRRSVHTPASHGGNYTGESMISFSPSSSCLKDCTEDPISPLKPFNNGFEVVKVKSPASDQSCLNAMQPCSNTSVPERAIFFWPDWRSNRNREFLVPDLNMSAEDLLPETTAADEIYEMNCRRLAAAAARRKRRELQRLKNSLAAGSPLCTRVG